jgi:YidC/Oxa1 family membrane protein insertase
MESIHCYAGIPWWGTIIVTALGLRFALFPVTVKATKLGARLQAAAPEIEVCMTFVF